MSNSSAARQQAILAARMGAVLGMAGLVHGVSDEAGLEEVADWAEDGVVAALADGDLVAFRHEVFCRALRSGWTLDENRATQSVPGHELLRRRDLHLAARVAAVPAYVPRSGFHQAFMDRVSKELTQEAHRMWVLGQKDAFAQSQDGRFVSLSYMGVSVAKAEGEAGRVSDASWRVCLESNLDLVPRGEHSVSVSVDGVQVLRTDGPITVEVHNHRLVVDEDGQENMASLSMSFTHEGVITDLVREDGQAAWTDSTMYEEVASLPPDDSPQAADRG